MKRAAFALAALALVPAAPASAQSRPTLKLSAQDVFGGSRPAALTGRSFTVRAVLRPYVAGEQVTVRVYRNGRKIRVKALTPKPINGGTAAVATLKVSSAKPGRVLLRASHKATPALPTLRAKTVGVEVVRPSAGPGARGPAVRLLQARLAGHALRRPAQRRLRRRHQSRRDGVAQGGRDGAHDDRDPGRLRRPAQGPGPGSRCATPATAATSRRG